ncbi:MAG: DUF2316 family protein, partial [Dermatophilaceae bacterium]
MSLTNEEMARTAAELDANRLRTGLRREEIAASLGFTLARLDATLGLDGDPVDVWLLRDYLEQAVHDAGRAAVVFTVLTPAARHRARTWFRLGPAPRHQFAAARAAGTQTD